MSGITSGLDFRMACIYLPIERSLLQPRNGISSADPQIQALGSDRCWELILSSAPYPLLWHSRQVWGFCLHTCVVPSSMFNPKAAALRLVQQWQLREKWMDKVIRYCSNRYQILFWWLQEILEINNFSHLTGASWSFLMPIVTQWCPCLVTMDTNGHRCNKLFFFLQFDGFHLILFSSHALHKSLKYIF